MGDGARWIWNLSAEQFPGAIEIVDIYHAKQHLCDVAKAIYGAGTDSAEQWARERHAELDAGRLGAHSAALCTQTETTPEARKCIHYVLGNRHRLSAVSREGTVRVLGRRRGRMQAARRTAQAHRHAVDRRRRQRHHRPGLLQAQRPLRGFRGATGRKHRLTVISPNLTCAALIRCRSLCADETMSGRAPALGCTGRLRDRLVTNRLPSVSSMSAADAVPIQPSAEDRGGPNIRRVVLVAAP